LLRRKELQCVFDEAHRFDLACFSVGSLVRVGQTFDVPASASAWSTPLFFGGGGLSQQGNAHSASNPYSICAAPPSPLHRPALPPERGSPRHWPQCSRVRARLLPVCLVAPGTDCGLAPRRTRAAATRFMSVPLWRSPPVLRAGSRWGKLDLAWRFGSPGARMGATVRYSGAAKTAGGAPFLATVRRRLGGQEGSNLDGKYIRRRAAWIFCIIHARAGQAMLRAAVAGSLGLGTGGQPPGAGYVVGRCTGLCQPPNWIRSASGSYLTTL
jgi:hypothetical protein